VEGAPQQADELAASQMTQPPPVLTQPSQLATGGATTGGGATPAGGGATPAGGGATPAGRATPNAAGSSQAAMATPSTDQLAPRVIRALDPWTYNQDHTWAGARAVRGKRGRRI
jgi:cytochrome c1